MQNSLVTIVLGCFLAVHGCASPDASTPGSDGAGGDGTQTAGSETAPMSAQGASTEPGGTPETVTDGSGQAADAGGATTTTTPPTVTDGSTSIEKPAEPPPEASPGTSVAQTEESTPVNASATEKDSVSTVARAEAALLSPTLAADTAPEVFKVKFITTKGDFVIEAHRSWAPNGADRLYNLVKIGFFTDVAFFRVMKNFVVQFGIHGDPDVSAAWLEATIKDDKVSGSNTRGFVSFADRRSSNTRTTQLFINLAGRNSYLDVDGYAPVGKVTDGMDVVESFHEDYGDGAPRGSGPNQTAIQSEGNEYLMREFPKLDYVKSAAIVE